MYERDRRKRVVAAARAVGVEALVVTHGPDVLYLCGFTGSSGAVALVGARAVLFTDGRYTAQAQGQVAEAGGGVRVAVDKRAPALRAVEWLAGQGVSRCGFDAGQTTVASLEAMRVAVKAKAGAAGRGFLVATDGLVAKLRQVKDSDEIGRMRRAAALGCSLFEGVLGRIKAGVTEAEVGARLEFEARMAGAEGMSFETIVTGGVRTALPHGRAGATKLPKKGFVTLDFGVLVEGYCSDMTRTVHLGKASGRERDVYHSVLEAQVAAVAAVGPGVRCGDVDEAARSVLRKAKLAKAFSHSTGHGVGLEIHEGPRLAAGQKQVLVPGNVVTIEPGAYLAGEFGIRIEDMVLVTADGVEVLTAASSKDLMELS